MDIRRESQVWPGPPRKAVALPAAVIALMPVIGLATPARAEKIEARKMAKKLADTPR